MTPRQRKPWSKIIEESGVAVRVYERESGSLLYREVRVEGGKDRKSLGHRDRVLAEQQGRELARRIAELRLTGHTGTVTLGQLIRLYRHHRYPLLGETAQRRATNCIRYFTEHLGDAFVVTNLSQSHVDTYAAARRGGVMGNRHRAVDERGVRDGTVKNDLTWLASLLNFGCGYKVNGRPLLAANPLRGLTIPKERNIRRPVASEERYRLTLAKADEADPSGRLACLLALSRYTGRRITAICELRASDILLSADALARALAAMGQDPGLSRHMPHGAIRWRAENDKQGYEDVGPISTQARAALEGYLRAPPGRRHVDVSPAQGPDQAHRDAARAYLAPTSRGARGPALHRARWIPQLPETVCGRTEAPAGCRRRALRRLAGPRHDEALVSAGSPRHDAARC